MLETAIRLGRTGTTSPDAVLWAFAASEVVVLTPAGETPAASNLAPLIVHRDAESFVAVFTNVDRISSDLGAGRTPVTIPAVLLLRGLSADAGVVVNPGTPEGFEVPAVAVNAFRAQLEDSGPSGDRYFVRQRFDGGALVPYALLRRRTGGAMSHDEVLRGIGQWEPDRNGTVDRALRFPLDSDLEEISAAQALEFEQMAAAGSFKPFTRL